MAGTGEFIATLPQGYETRIAESGHNLSGGQRQRISIARALLSEAPILMLDEPTSAQDPGHEHRIVETLRRIKGQRTIVIISHRLNVVVDCDRIHVMANGHIVEQGTHRELMAAQGPYFRMATQQVAFQMG